VVRLPAVVSRFIHRQKSLEKRLAYTLVFTVRHTTFRSPHDPFVDSSNTTSIVNGIQPLISGVRHVLESSWPKS
jgi:hypothetical protein